MENLKINKYKVIFQAVLLAGDLDRERALAAPAGLGSLFLGALVAFLGALPALPPEGDLVAADDEVVVDLALGALEALAPPELSFLPPDDEEVFLEALTTKAVPDAATLRAALVAMVTRLSAERSPRIVDRYSAAECRIPRFPVCIARPHCIQYSFVCSVWCWRVVCGVKSSAVCSLQTVAVVISKRASPHAAHYSTDSQSTAHSRVLRRKPAT